MISALVERHGFNFDIVAELFNNNRFFIEGARMRSGAELEERYATLGVKAPTFLEDERATGAQRDIAMKRCAFFAHVTLEQSNTF